MYLDLYQMILRLLLQAVQLIIRMLHDTIASIAGAGDINLSSYTLTIGGDNASTEVSGVISGTGSLTKSGTGTLTLSGTNTYDRYNNNFSRYFTIKWIGFC
jgi:uncharacterized protein with beta-barrel porin domain